MTSTELPRWSLDDVHESVDARSFNDAMERSAADVERLVALFDENFFADVTAPVPRSAAPTRRGVHLGERQGGGPPVATERPIALDPQAPVETQPVAPFEPLREADRPDAPLPLQIEGAPVLGVLHGASALRQAAAAPIGTIEPR